MFHSASAPITHSSAAAALCFAAIVSGAGVAEATGGFSQWLADFQNEAIERGISEATVQAALADVVPIPHVLELDRKQPGAKPSDFCKYMVR